MPAPADPANNPDLQRQVDELRARVSALEHQLALTPGKAQPIIKPADSPFTLTLVNRIGALTLALGILFFFKYAADSGWIGPVARVWIGIVTGLLLIGSSEWIDRRQGRLLSQGLAACGLATLFISLYAAYGYYKLLLATAAFLFLLLLCQATIAFSVRRKNLAIAALGLFGTLLIPELVELARPESWRTVEAIYLFLLQAQSLFIAGKLSSRYLPAFSATALTVAALLRIEPHGYLPFLLLAIGLSALHFVASSLTRLLSASVYLTAYAIGHCFAVIAAFKAISEWSPNPATASTLGSVLLAIYGIALLAYGLAKASALNRILGLAFLGLVVAKLYLYDIWQLNYAARITAFVILGGLLLGASFLYSRTKSRDH